MAFSSFNSRIMLPLTGNAGFIPGDITNITFSGFSAAEIDVTKLTSAGKEFVLGTRDPGTVTITTMANVSPTSVTPANIPPVPTSGGTAQTYNVYFGGLSGTLGLKFSFSAYIISTTMDAAVDSAVGVTYTLQITGSVVVTYS